MAVHGVNAQQYDRFNGLSVTVVELLAELNFLGPASVQEVAI